MNKLKIGKKYEIEWIDAIAYHGWYNIEDVEDIVKNYRVKTIGFFVKKTKLFIILSQSKSYQNQHKQYGNIKYIPIGTIINSKELK